MGGSKQQQLEKDSREWDPSERKKVHVKKTAESRAWRKLQKGTEPDENGKNKEGVCEEGKVRLKGFEARHQIPKHPGTVLELIRRKPCLWTQ